MMLMIFDLLTSPQGHQFGHRMKMLLNSALLVISVDLICHMAMFEKRPPGNPSAPKSHPFGMTQATE